MSTYLYYGSIIAFYDDFNKGHLYARGFINKSLLFNCDKAAKTESQFIILPKIINMEALEDQRFKGNPNPVLFGSQFCLKHVNSGFYMCGSGQTLENLNGFRIEMSERFTKDCVFKLSPLGTIEHEWDLVSTNSVFLIKNIKYKCYINVDKDTIVATKQSINVQTGKHIEKTIFTETENLKACKLSFEKTSRWKFTQKLTNYEDKKYLQQNQYIYFTYTEDNSIVTVDTTTMSLVYKLRDFTNSQVYRALWEVEYFAENKTKQQLRLRHVLTGKYFAPQMSSTPTKITLKPIIEPENRLPPFDIYVNDVKLLKISTRENEQLHAFQINKADRKYIKEIQSIKGMPPAIWVPYMINFLKTDTSIKQSMLREFSIIDQVLAMLSNDKLRTQLCYDLLYDACRGSIKNKKKICQNISRILDEQNKLYSQQLLTELLSQNYDQSEDVIEKEIKADRIQKFLQDFIVLEHRYDIQYMRILRAFTGTFKKSNVRNQSIIFQYFFYIKESDIPKNDDMTKSVIIYRPSFQVPSELKCRFEKQGKVMFRIFEGGHSKLVEIDELEEPKKNFYRQYLYLLGDCMKNRMEKNIVDFRKEFSLEILCDILREPSMNSFKGPVLNLIKCAYVDFKPYFRCQLYFLNGWSELAYKGKLVSILHESDHELFFVLDFIANQLAVVRDYEESYNLILLQTLKLTIQFGFWKNIEQLSEIKKHLDRLIFFKIEEQTKMMNIRQSRKEYRRKSNNIILSKIVAVDIYRLLLNLQLNLWVSELVEYRGNESKIIQKIDLWLESQTSDWKLDSRFFALASQKNSELMKNSLKLFYRLFNLKKELYNMLYEAWGDDSIEEAKSPQKIKKEQKDKNFANLVTKNTFSQFHTFETIIEVLIDEFDGFKVATSLTTFQQSFQQVFNNKSANKYYQNLAIKFGLHIRIIEQLSKINPLSIKSKKISMILMSIWLLIAIIKDNTNSKKAVLKYRRQVTKFMVNLQIAGLCIDFIEQLYVSNKLLITDYKEIENISENILRCLVEARRQNRQIECCKIIIVLHSLLTLQNKDLQVNQSILIFQILKKQFASVLQPITKENNETAVLYNIMMYSLMSTLGQQNIKTKFMFKYNFDMLQTLFEQFRKNWQVRSRIRLYINETILEINVDRLPQIAEEDMMTRQRSRAEIEEELLETCIEDLLIANDVLNDEKRHFKWEIFEFQRNLRQILVCFKKLLKGFSDMFYKDRLPNSNNLKSLMWDVYDRIYSIKDHCSVDLLVEIESLKSYIANLMDRIEVSSLSVESSAFIKALAQLGRSDSTMFKKSDIVASLVRKQSNAHQKKVSRDRRRSTLAQNQLVSYLKDASRMSMKSLSHEKIAQVDEEVLKNFIKNAIEINEKDDSVLTDEIKLFIVNFLTESMLKGQKNQNRKLDVEQWYSDLSNNAEMFQSGQELYLRSQLEIPQLICSMLQEPFHQRYKLYDGILELGICLIFGGNTQFQNRFIKVFKKDRKNTILSNLSTILSETLKNVEFFYKSPSKLEDDSKISYPTVLRYELTMELPQIQTSRQERRDSCSLVWKIFRMLQLLCQNNNTEMKEYIQNQSDEEGKVKYTSLNFIEQANKTLWEVMDILRQNLRELRSFYKNMEQSVETDELFYRSLKKEIQENLCRIPIIIIEFLIEVCQIPSQKNQVYLCRTNFLEIIKRIEECIADLEDRDEDRFSDQIKIRENGVEVSFFFVIQKKIIVLILSLLEPNDPFIKEILHKNFTTQAFKFLLRQSFHYCNIVDISKLNQVISQYKMKPQLLNIISLLIIKKSLGKEMEIFNKKEEEPSWIVTPNMITILESRIRSIQVDLYRKTLTVYFPYIPLFEFLSMRTKEQILYQRFESRNEKLRYMLDSRELIYEEIEYEYQVHNKWINEKNLGRLHLTSLYFSYLIIALLILFYSVTGPILKLDILENVIITYTASLQFLLTLMHVILWGIHQYPIVLAHYNKKHGSVEHGTLRSKIKFIPTMLKMVYIDNEKSRGVIFFFVLSFLSAFVSVRFYAFNLFFFFAQIDVSKNIFAAIYTNAKPLIVVCVFGLTFAFVFAFVTLNTYLVPLFENEDVDIAIANSEIGHCNTVLSCILSLYTQQTIGDWSNGSATSDYYIFLFNLIFVGFSEILFNNMVAGIMIDKFAELRDTREKIEAEIRNTCYICSADRSSLEKRAQSFENHLNEVHNIWNYFFYMYTLERMKESNDFTGIEYWIQDKINKEDIEWFPYQRIYKDNVVEEKVDIIQRKLDRLMLEMEESKKKQEI